uniref:Si:dkey-219e21.2 n=1 Tax=Astyanax mexicanus TaxID=7994 RepID=A0A3B1K8A8_ASTMX
MFIYFIVDDYDDYGLQPMKTQKSTNQHPTLLYNTVDVNLDPMTNHPWLLLSDDYKKVQEALQESYVPPSSQRFDTWPCVLGWEGYMQGRQHYWEVDVHCCSDWAVGVAYGSLNRKGQDKSTKLGRNRMSWCLEFKDGHLSAWHNDRHVALSGRAGRGAPDRVGVYVNYQKGPSTAVFERAYHQFTEPLFPAFRFFKARDGQSRETRKLSEPTGKKNERNVKKCFR